MSECIVDQLRILHWKTGGNIRFPAAVLLLTALRQSAGVVVIGLAFLVAWTNAMGLSYQYLVKGSDNAFFISNVLLVYIDWIEYWYEFFWVVSKLNLSGDWNNIFFCKSYFVFIDAFSKPKLAKIKVAISVELMQWFELRGLNSFMWSEPLCTVGLLCAPEALQAAAWWLQLWRKRGEDCFGLLCWLAEVPRIMNCGYQADEWRYISSACPVEWELSRSLFLCSLCWLCCMANILW